MRYFFICKILCVFCPPTFLKCLLLLFTLICYILNIIGSKLYSEIINYILYIWFSYETIRVLWHKGFFKQRRRQKTNRICKFALAPQTYIIAALRILSICLSFHPKWFAHISYLHFVFVKARTTTHAHATHSTDCDATEREIGPHK